MYWINKKTFSTGFLDSIKKSRKHQFRYFGFPIIYILFFYILKLLTLKKFENIFLTYYENPILLGPFFFYFMHTYVINLFGNYFSIKQEFYIKNNSVQVKNFRNLFWLKKELNFNLEDILWIGYEKYTGASLVISPFTTVIIAYISDEEFEILLKCFNPNGKIPIKSDDYKTIKQE